MQRYINLQFCKLKTVFFHAFLLPMPFKRIDNILFVNCFGFQIAISHFMTETDSQSLFTRIRKNSLALVSAIFIGFAVLLAIFAYYIAPDSSPNANNQFLELSKMNPGTEVMFLKIPKTFYKFI